MSEKIEKNKKGFWSSVFIGGKMDLTFFFLLLIILLTGLVMLFSASYVYADTRYHNSYYFITKQAVFAVFGVLMMLLISRIDYHFVRKFAIPFYIIIVIFLGVMLILPPMVPNTSVKRWFSVGPINFQPSELAKQAVRILDQMQEKGLDIEFVEQPVPAADLEGMQYVTRHASVPVLADARVFSPADALRIMQTGAADFVNIKLMKCGGITNALRIASAAEVYGVECMIGCMLEAKISVNAAVELACAKKIITKVDLDGPVLCSEDHILGGAVFDEKNITVSDAPGMGIQGFVPGKVTYLDD